MPHKNRTTLISFLTLLLVLLVVNFRMLSPYMLAVMMGGILALMSRPLYTWLKRRGIGPKSAAALVTFAVADASPPISR